jgi:hypothetical protein
MYLDQAGLRIAAVGPAIVTTPGPIAKCLTFSQMSDMSGHVRHLRKCQTFGDRSDIWRIGPTMSELVFMCIEYEHIQHKVIGLKSVCMCDSNC